MHQFADQHNLSFNVDKNQLVKFYLSNSISHLDHILTYNLSDDDDICAISKDTLPRHSHTGIVHSVARLESIYNIVVIRSRSLLPSARRSKCALISDLFSECAQSTYTALGNNNLFGGKHLKCYTVDDELCAAFIRDARSDPQLNKHLDDDVYCISTV